MDVLAIADDATGALETGAKLAGSGIGSLVTIQRRLELNPPALVVDTETRHLTGETARDRVRALGREARLLGVRYIYKKTDSTLRGNIGAEFRGLLDVFDDRPIVYVPAWPLMGRTVKHGRLLVNDLPLERTAFARDIRSPVKSGSILEVLGSNCPVKVRLAAEASALRAILGGGAAGEVALCDGSTEEDLEVLASALTAYDAPYIAAGPTGFLGHWIGRLLPSTRRTSELPDMRRGLVVSGSLHPVSVQQIHAAGRAGLPVFHLSPAPSSDSELSAGVSTALLTHRWAGLVTSPRTRSGAEAVAGRLASITRAVLTQEGTGLLVIFGGDTTLAIFQALGIETVTSCTELLPGIPLSRASFAGRRLDVITKAGGFGDADVLTSIRQWRQ
jgi:uncharacterized protein YgbK (DUF1537 family)